MLFRIGILITLVYIGLLPAQDCQNVRLLNNKINPNDNIDDNDSIQVVINNTPNGGCLYFPQGTVGYRIKKTITSEKEHGFRIRGDRNTKFMNRAIGPVFRFGKPLGQDGAGHGRWDGLILENFTIDNTGTGDIGSGIDIHWYDMVRIERVTVSGGSNTDQLGGSYGIMLDYCYNNTLVEVQCQRQNNAALLLRNSCDKTTITGGAFGGGEKGIVIEGGKGISIIGAGIETNNGNGVELAWSKLAGRTEFPSAVNLIGNYFENNCLKGGVGYLVIGTDPNNSNLDFTRSVNVIGNFFNWGQCENYGGGVCLPRPPQSTATPFVRFEHASFVNLQGNHYVSSSNPPAPGVLVQVAAYANKPRLQPLNDNSASDLGLQDQFVRSSDNRAVVPYSDSVVVDVNGNGYVEYPLTGYRFAWATATANATGNHTSNTRLDITFTKDTSNPPLYTKVRVTVVNAADFTKKVPISCIVVGR